MTRQIGFKTIVEMVRGAVSRFVERSKSLTLFIPHCQQGLKLRSLRIFVDY